MSWIKTVSYENAGVGLKKIYNRVKGPNHQIDNILKVHSLRPHTLTGHMTLYKNVLHHSENTLPKWFLESIGIFVSHLNNCRYCVDHHLAGLKRLMDDKDRARKIYMAILSGDLANTLDGRYGRAVYYIQTLTRSPEKLTYDMVERLKKDFSDGEILEINQVVGYFSYANRTVLGLGVTSDGDILGLSPNDNENPENWGHR